MDKRITFKEFLFILPILAIICVFSIWPILDSIKYTVFDYRLNDQQNSKMFLGSSFNTSSFNENAKYVAYYLKKDMESIQDNTQKQEFERIGAYVKEMLLTYESQDQNIKLSGSEAHEMEAFIKSVRVDVTNLYEANKDEQLSNRENIQMIIEDLEKCLISSNFIGLGSYGRVLQDLRFWSALKNTIVFTVISVSIEFTLGLALAMIMNKAMKGIGIIRTVSLIPWAIPTAVSALMWSYMYDGGSGVIAKLLSVIGLVSSPEHLLLTSTGAMVCAIIADVWKTTPYMALLLLGGLQTIDSGLYESSQIDGAGKIKTFLAITLPLLKPAILVAVLFRTLDAFRVYDLIAVLTGGGPGGSTETLSIYAYKIMFGQTNFGYGSVIVMMMFICVAAIAALFVKVLGADVMSKN
ncbi:carbohydrate ABC transporter permease [Cellulosilyticum sp. I15G10I2]|uniref:carbohydrate ABC transporter permease n=1 Tax=Cellulosilyticum sp. I15G10I2 TaxID=1892843 RepID=UPI00085BF5AD|nr:sugar ABC transporter permease [Cellulosilyticum sp. I15G10I2]